MLFFVHGEAWLHRQSLGHCISLYSDVIKDNVRDLQKSLDISKIQEFLIHFFAYTVYYIVYKPNIFFSCNQQSFILFVKVFSSLFNYGVFL